MTRTPPASTSRAPSPRTASDLVRPAERRDDGAVAVAPLGRRSAGAAPAPRAVAPAVATSASAVATPPSSVTPAAATAPATVRRAERPRPLAREAGPADRDRLVFGDAQRGRVRRARDQEVALCARERGAARERRGPRALSAPATATPPNAAAPAARDVPVAAHGEHVAAPPAGAHAQVVEVGDAARFASRPKIVPE